jgi:hypothetical protein
VTGAFTVSSRAFGGTAVVVSFPPGHRTLSVIGPLVLAKTVTGLSCDQ